MTQHHWGAKDQFFCVQLGSTLVGFYQLRNSTANYKFVLPRQPSVYEFEQRRILTKDSLYSHY